MSTPHGSPTVPTAAVTEAAHVLQDRVDVLLDRLTDRLLGLPAPGSAAWTHEFRQPSVSAQHRLRVRTAILNAAGFTAPRGRAGAARRSGRVDPAQLTMF